MYISDLKLKIRRCCRLLLFGERIEKNRYWGIIKGCWPMRGRIMWVRNRRLFVYKLFALSYGLVADLLLSKGLAVPSLLD